MADPLFLVHVLARLVNKSRSVAVGTNSPIPAAATLLAREQTKRQGGRLVISILGSPRHSPFTDGGRELFDFAAQGRLDSFFLGGGQIDGNGNVNLLSIGAPSRPKLRFPGSFGSAYLASLVPNVVLFRQEHSPRVLVPKVDFVSAAGSGPVGSYRPGGPRWLVTERAVFRFEPDAKRFLLHSIHPGESLTEVIALTGFDAPLDDGFHETPAPDGLTAKLLHGPVAQELAFAYPRFAAQHFPTKDPTA